MVESLEIDMMEAVAAGEEAKKRNERTRWEKYSRFECSISDRYLSFFRRLAKAFQGEGKCGGILLT